jgi:hypothetical protein
VNPSTQAGSDPMEREIVISDVDGGSGPSMSPRLGEISQAALPLIKG